MMVCRAIETVIIIVVANLKDNDVAAWTKG